MAAALDAVAVFLSGFFATLFVQADPTLFIYPITLAAVLALTIQNNLGTYETGNLNDWPLFFNRVWLWPVTFLAALAPASVGHSNQMYLSLLAGIWIVLALVCLFVSRAMAGMGVSWLRKGGWLVRRIVVIGAGEHGRRLVEQLEVEKESVSVIGYFDDRKDRLPDIIAGKPVLGTLDDLLIYARTQPVDLAIIALPRGAESRLTLWLKKLRNVPLDIAHCADLTPIDRHKSMVTDVCGIPILQVSQRPLRGWKWIAKALEDRLLAIFLLILTMPMMAIIAICVKLSSKGPALFVQQRYGFNNQVINVYKFRSLSVDSSCEGSGRGDVTRNDPRVTKLGQFLRKHSLDELPQLFNVLRGEMSLVGPRPHTIEHNVHFSTIIDQYLGRHNVKPGITGWAQVNGYRGGIHNLEQMELRVQHDLFYIEHWSLAFDFQILIRTLLVGFRHPNAF